jgi:hypothetical protein
MDNELDKKPNVIVVDVTDFLEGDYTVAVMASHLELVLSFYVDPVALLMILTSTYLPGSDEIVSDYLCSVIPKELIDDEDLFCDLLEFCETIVVLFDEYLQNFMKDNKQVQCFTSCMKVDKTVLMFLYPS